jgi:serine/threonine protein kinase
MTTEAIGGNGASGVPRTEAVGRYRLVQQLGEGGMGVVHLALDPSGRAVAMKLLRPHIALDPDARARLAREVDVLSRVRDPRVAPVLDADLDGAQPYIVTRYVPGPSLDEVVREHGPLAGADLHRLGRGLAGALHAIHAADVIHRDLKPANVLLLDGDPVVIDFGIAHVADDVRITLAGLVMGTPGYLSPEVVEGGAVTEATDWWGWAATLAFAASGAPPFGRGPMDVVLNRVARGEADLSGVDPRLAPLLYAALSPRPLERPHADEVVEALERYAAGKPATEIVAAVPATRHTQVIEQQATARERLPVGPLALPRTPSRGRPRTPDRWTAGVSPPTRSRTGRPPGRHSPGSQTPALAGPSGPGRYWPCCSRSSPLPRTGPWPLSGWWCCGAGWPARRTAPSPRS